MGHNFGWAVDQMKHGKKVSRNGWNGKGMWIRQIDLYTDKQFSLVENAGSVGTWLPFVVMKTADEKLVPWLASQTDILSDDWSVL